MCALLLDELATVLDVEAASLGLCHAATLEVGDDAGGGGGVGHALDAAGYAAFIIDELECIYIGGAAAIEGHLSGAGSIVFCSVLTVFSKFSVQYEFYLFACGDTTRACFGSAFERLAKVGHSRWTAPSEVLPVFRGLNGYGHTGVALALIEKLGVRLSAVFEFNEFVDFSIEVIHLSLLLSDDFCGGVVFKHFTLIGEHDLCVGAECSGSEEDE